LASTTWKPVAAPSSLAFDDRERQDGRRRGRAFGDLLGRHRVQVIAATEPGRAGHLVEGVDVEGRGRALDRERAVDLAREAVPEDEREREVLKVARLGRRGQVGVVVLVPGDRPIGEPVRLLGSNGRARRDRRDGERAGGAGELRS
jgi:hypothetical protein